MATFSVLLLTALPPGQTGEPSGAFVKIDGREALLKSTELFLNRDNVKQIRICFLSEALEEARRKYAPHLSFSGVKVLSGGPKWIDQIAAGATISDDCTHVLVHDAARPAVPYSDIEAVMEASEKNDAVALTAPLRNNLVEVDEGKNAIAFHTTSRYMQLLTPQIYSKAKFEQMAKSKQEPHPSEFHLVHGSALNIRITSAADASLLKAMINLLPKPKMKPPSSPFEEAQW
jgi:2-C-methyl-D-erythritol 4-phosphate cytidylyltransferase